MDSVQRDGAFKPGPDDIEVRLLTATIALAVDGGYAAVRQRDVAARAGVAMATVYARYSGKDDLLAAALVAESESIVQRVRKLPLRGRTPLARATKMFEYLTDAIVERPLLTRAALRAANSGQHGTTMRLMVIQQRFTELLVGALQGAPKKPDIDADDALRVATVLVMVWSANLTGWAGGVADGPLVVAVMEQAADMLLHGVPSAKK